MSRGLIEDVLDVKLSLGARFELVAVKIKSVIKSAARSLNRTFMRYPSRNDASETIYRHDMPSDRWEKGPTCSKAIERWGNNPAPFYSRCKSCTAVNAHCVQRTRCVRYSTVFRIFKNFSTHQKETCGSLFVYAR